MINETLKITTTSSTITPSTTIRTTTVYNEVVEVLTTGYNYEDEIEAEYDADKNYGDLVDMISYHTESFPVEKFQDYGCHCRESLNRNLPGLGRGLDAIDAGCSQWKRCLRCAKITHGENCKSEEEKYIVELLTDAYSSRYSCSQSVGTCKRAICECDLQFARELGKRSKEWVEKHAPSSFDAIEQCIPQIGSGFESGCCNNPISGLVSMFNKKEQCCDSQGLIQQGQCQDHLMSYRRR